MTEQKLRDAMELYGDTVFRLALCRLQNTADAEDVYQDVFLKLFQQEHLSNSDPEHIKAWLIRSTVNRCTDLMRFHFRRSTISLDTLGEAAAMVEESAAELWTAVNDLPAKFRVVVHLHYAEGYSTEEIAALLEIPVVTVRTRMRRARMRLKDVLGGNEDG
ncbi:MAG: sigma-70 family RNA polymerase sigma factor [Ruminococcaceae bacterium]|nr:sigma-70 family RNA polymerase sigma factor [Oscillospiraceae bacterium]